MLSARHKRSRARHPASGPVLGYTEDGFPIVPVTIEHHPKGSVLRLAACPFCGRPHEHGGPHDNPSYSEGHRISHCLTSAPGDRGYILCAVGKEK